MHTSIQHRRETIKGATTLLRKAIIIAKLHGHPSRSKVDTKEQNANARPISKNMGIEQPTSLPSKTDTMKIMTEAKKIG